MLGGATSGIVDGSTTTATGGEVGSAGTVGRRIEVSVSDPADELSPSPVDVRTRSKPNTAIAPKRSQAHTGRTKSRRRHQATRADFRFRGRFVGLAFVSVSCVGVTCVGAVGSGAVGSDVISSVKSCSVQNSSGHDSSGHIGFGASAFGGAPGNRSFGGAIGSPSGGGSDGVVSSSTPCTVARSFFLSSPSVRNCSDRLPYFPT